MNKLIFYVNNFPIILSFKLKKLSEVMQMVIMKIYAITCKILKKAPYNFNALTSKGHAEKTLGKTKML